MKKYILIGPRSVGKTTLGKILAKKLDILFCDLDSIVDKELGNLDIFIQRYGVKKYRYAEQKILKKYSKNLPKEFVFAIGGGTIASQFESVNKKNIDLLKSLGILIYICPANSQKDSIEFLYTNEVKRHGDKSRKEITKLFNLRCPVYDKVCDKKILVKNKSNNYIIKSIIRVVAFF